MNFNFHLLITFLLISGYCSLVACQSSASKEEKTAVAEIAPLAARPGTLAATRPVPDSVAFISVRAARPELKPQPKAATPPERNPGRSPATPKKQALPTKSNQTATINKSDTIKQKPAGSPVNLRSEVNFSQGLPKRLKKEIATTHGLSLDKEKTWKGQPLARFELRTEDVKNGIVRSEILLNSDKEPESKYSWVMYFPHEYWQPTDKSDIVMQLHGFDDKHLGEKARNPQFALHVLKDRLRVTIHHSDREVNTNKNDIDEFFNLGPLPKDEFLEMVLEIRHSYEADGYAKLTINGKQVLDYKGGTSFNDRRKYPVFKTGIYNRQLKADRVVYIGNIRHRNLKSSIPDVAP